MSMMLSKTYDALISAGAPEEKAREAAEELASYDNRFANLETDMKIVKMMLALILAGIASLIVKAFFV